MIIELENISNQNSKDNDYNKEIDPSNDGILTSSEIEWNLQVDKQIKISHIVTYVLISYWPLVLLLGIVRLFYVFWNDKTLKKLQPITNILVTLSALSYTLLFALRLQGIEYYLCILEKLGDMGIFVTYLMILLFWINSLLVDDGKVQIIRHTKTFLFLVVFLFMMEIMYCVTDSMDMLEQANSSDAFKIVLVYNIYKTVLAFLFFIGFCSTGFLIHRKAQKLASRNRKRFRRSGLLIGFTFLILCICNIIADTSSLYDDFGSYRVATTFIVLINIIYGILAILILFFVFSDSQISRDRSGQKLNSSGTISSTSLTSSITIQKV